MYLIVKNYFDEATKTSYYSSFGGHFAGQPTATGIEPDSSPLRGYLLAMTQGLRQIEGLHGIQIRHKVAVLLEDQAIAEIFRIKEGVDETEEDADVWNAFFAKRANFGELTYITNPSQSDHFVVLWKWSSVPPERAEPPVVLW